MTGITSSTRIRLGDLLTVIRGVTYKKEDATAAPGPGRLPLIRATNIQDGLVFDSLVYIPSRYVSAQQRLQENDIVIAASSGSASIVGKAAQLTQPWDGTFGAFCYGLRSNGRANSRYIAWFLQTSEYRSRMSQLAAGVNINNLRATHIEETEISLPSLDAQNSIVAEIEKQFSRLDAGVAALKRVQANLKRYRAAVLKAACEGKLVPTEAKLARQERRQYESGAQLLERILEERRAKWNGRGLYKEPAALNVAEIPGLPDGWTWGRVEQIADVALGKMLDRQKHRTGKRLRYLRNINVRWGSVDTDDLSEMYFREEELLRYVLIDGDVLVCEGGEPGRSALWNAIIPEMMYQKALHRVRFYGALKSQYMVYILESLAKSGRLEPFFTGSTVKHFTRESFVKLPVPIPPLAEQVRIVAEVEQRLSVVEEIETAVEAGLKRAARLRQAVLQKAFCGNHE